VLSDVDCLHTVTRYGEKVLRGGKHIDSLKEAAERFVKEHGDPGIPCSTEANSQGTKVLLKVESLPQGFDLQWGVIVGDAVHCFRSALDQLVSALWTDTLTNSTGFPICHTEREWIVDAPRMYWSVPAPYLALIKRAQPYHRGNAEAARKHPLAILHSLWNLDKHRAIPTVALVANRIDIDVVEAHGVRIGKFRTKPGVTLKPGAVIAEAKIESVDPNVVQSHVKVKAHMALAVGFGNSPELPTAIRSQPVAKAFHDVIAPAMAHVLHDLTDVQQGRPFRQEWEAAEA
jgi:hypothetical protein